MRKDLDGNDNYLLKKRFALALHEAMLNSSDLRAFLKDEALKKFDYDYDILYNLVKNEPVGNSTFKEMLLEYFEDESELDNVERSLEALTIFIPTLPNESFSAESWDTESEVPLVAIKLLNNDKTPIIDSQEESFLLGDDVIPGFPVVVLKECERVTVPSYAGYDSNKTEEIIGSNGFRFRFSDDYYNAQKGRVTRSTSTEHLITAWEVNGREANTGWHRDHIYFNISQANSSGQWINNFSEFIRDFKIEGSDGFAALGNIAQPSSVITNLSDPSLRNIFFQSGSQISQGSFWTDGNFEFSVNMLYNKDTAALKKPFDAQPEQLFNITYRSSNIFNIITVYRITDIYPIHYQLNLDMLTWNINDYSNQWKFAFEETDLNVERTNTDEFTSKFNTNLSFTGIELWKFGAELGGSFEGTENNSVELKWTEQSNILGEAIVRFGDNTIVRQRRNNVFIGFERYDLRRYEGRFCSFSLIPLRVQ